MKKYTVASNKKKEIEIEGQGEYVVELVGEGAEVVVVGRFVAGVSRQLSVGSDQKGVVVCGGDCEVKVTIVHKAGNTRAETLLKGVGYEASKMKLEGKIVVEKGCPNTNSFLTEKVLLVGEKATAEAVPDLEIESDDVKCSHAATISRIPKQQLFYLMSRGVSKGEAEEMVVEGFLG